MRLHLASLLLFSSTALQAQVERGHESPGIEVGLVETGNTKLDDFSLSFRLNIKEDPKNVTVFLANTEHLKMVVEAGKEIKVAVDIQTPSGEKLKLSAPLQSDGQSMGGLHHIVLRVRRDARQALTGLWVDGVEVVSGPLARGPLPLATSSLAMEDESVPGVVSEVRLYDRALSRPEILELGQKLPVESKSRPKGMDGFEIEKDDVIAVLGGTEAVAIMEEGSLEAHILLAHAEKRPKMRSLAWETDTVFRQDRPLNFGDLRQQLQRTQATCVMLMFGRQECLERAEAGLAEFREALDRMVKTSAEVTPKLVLVQAAPFEKKAAPLRDLSELNPVLARYNEIIREVAQAHGAYYAGSSEGWNPARPQPMTSDGVNLTQTGARELGLRVMSSSLSPEPEGTQELKAAIAAKNRLWHDYWRPSNWAFLHGDRTSQPSSRDHLDPRRRWFPAELEQYQALIEAKENELWKKAEELGRKLP